MDSFIFTVHFYLWGSCKICEYWYYLIWTLQRLVSEPSNTWSQRLWNLFAVAQGPLAFHVLESHISGCDFNWYGCRFLCKLWSRC